MQVTALIVTEHNEFANRWRTKLTDRKVLARTVSPSELSDQLAPSCLVVLDAASEGLQNDELLVMAGYARALGAIPSIVYPPGKRDGNGEVLEDICSRLVTSTIGDENTLLETLARKAHSIERHHFEYVTVAPSGKDILAIYADGDCILLPRPLDTEDDLSEIASIVLHESDTVAELELKSGKSLRLHAVSPNHPHRRPSSWSGIRRSGAFGRTTANPGGIGGISFSREPGAGNFGEGKAARLGARIRELRVAAGLTQAELAKRTGIHRPNIARVEAGRHTPSLETLAKLSLAMGVTTTDLIADE